MPLFLLLILLLLPLSADELAIDPPTIWPADCIPCRPYELPYYPLKEIQDNVVVDLKDPLYENGILTTEAGGILTAPELRVQAQKIVYTRHLESDTPIFNVFCEGNLLIDYKAWTLTGDSLYYDFLTHTGYLTNGRTASPPWYVGGEEILLLNEGNLVVLDGYLTTSESDPREVIIRMPSLSLSSNRVIRASSISLRVKKVPLLWFPGFKYDLKNIGARSPFGVQFGWGGFKGSYLSLLYHFLSWKDLMATARIDGFFGHGVGAGIDTVYNPKNSPMEAYTRSYYANDIAIDDPIRHHRYRFEGTFYDELPNNITIDGMYDVVSDGEMAADYQTKDFDLNTAERTQVEFRTQQNAWIASLFTKVRVNDFQSVNQELPSFRFHLHPFEIPSTGIMVENTFKASFYHYIFSEDVPERSFHSGRIAVHPLLYRPFFLKAATVTPEAGFIGIAYTSSPDRHSSAGQAIGKFGVKLETALSKCIGPYKHVIEPYAHYHFLTQPSVGVDKHFIFTIQDGYDKLNLVRFGFRNSLFSKGPCGIVRSLWVDLWANAFFDTATIPQTIPKGYIRFEWEPFNRIFIGGDGAWNFAHRQVDYINGRVKWSFHENLAFSLELRHRGAFDWRKDDFYNFILESARPEQELLASPLSDHRNTLLFLVFLRLSPGWAAKFDLRKGWDRFAFNMETEKREHQHYLEYQAELSTVLYQHWRFKFIYERRVADNRFSISLKLDPGPPPKRKACY